MRIPSGVTTAYLYFVAVDATDLKTRETGLSSFTVQRSRNGAAEVAYTTPTITEIDNTNMPGVYALLIDEDTTIASGHDDEEYCVHITHAGMAPVTRTLELYRAKSTIGDTITSSSGVVRANNSNGDPITGVGSIYILTAAGAVTFYSTFDLAYAAVSSGDFLYCGKSQTATDAVDINNWTLFVPHGVTLTRASGSLITGTSRTTTILGDGDFVASNGICIDLTTPTLARIRGRNFTSTGSNNAAVKVDTATGTGVYTYDHEWTGRVRGINYDGCWFDGNGDGVLNFRLKGPDLTTFGNNPIEFGLESFTNVRINGYADIDRIDCRSNTGAIINAQGSTGKFHLKTKQIIGQCTTGSAATLLYSTVTNFALEVEGAHIKARHVTNADTPVWLRNCHLDSTGADADTVDIQHNGTVFENGQITTDPGETNSIVGTAGKVLTVVGNVAMNKAVSGPTLTYSDAADSPNAVTAQGKIATNLDARVSAIDTAVGLVKAQTDQLEFTTDGVVADAGDTGGGEGGSSLIVTPIQANAANPRYSVRDLAPIAQNSAPTDIKNIVDGNGDPIDLSSTPLRLVFALITDEDARDVALPDATIEGSWKYETSDVDDSVGGLAVGGDDNNQVTVTHDWENNDTAGWYFYWLWDVDTRIVLLRGRVQIEQSVYDVA